jgi:hypothetical protein
MSKLASAYTGLFFLAQIVGVLFGLLGFLAPRQYVTWGFFPGILALWVAMVISSILIPIHIWRSKLPPALYVLPVWQLLGEGSRNLYVGRLKVQWMAREGLEPVTAGMMAALDPNSLTLALAHSGLGLIAALYVARLASEYEARRVRRPAGATRRPVRSAR